MAQFLLILLGALVVGAIGFGVFALIFGNDSGLEPAEPDGQAVPPPANRPLDESDIGALRFDTAVRGYRMAQVDLALRRLAYDVGYKEELIGVLEAEVRALRAGRTEEADALRRIRQAATRQPTAGAQTASVQQAGVQAFGVQQAGVQTAVLTRDDGVGDPEQPGAAQADSTIAITSRFFPAGFFLFFCRPRILIDGVQSGVSEWGRSAIAVPAGQHQVHIHTPYLMPVRMGPADLTVTVQPGQVLELEYRAPVITFSPGKLGAMVKEYRQQRFYAVPGAIVVGVAPALFCLASVLSRVISVTTH